MAVDSTPLNSWKVYSTGEQNQFQHPQYRLRSRYIRTKDPLPNMNYKQLEKALPPNYDLPKTRPPMESGERPPEFFEAEIPQLDESWVGEETLPVEEAPPVQEEFAYQISLNPTSGYVGDEVSVESVGGFPEIDGVYVNGTQANFVMVSYTNLVFEIPAGATSGPVELVYPDGSVLDAGILEVIGG